MRQFLFSDYYSQVKKACFQRLETIMFGILIMYNFLGQSHFCEGLAINFLLIKLTCNCPFINVLNLNILFNNLVKKKLKINIPLLHLVL